MGGSAHKGIISWPSQGNWDKPELKRLAAIAPGCTLNIVRGGVVPRLGLRHHRTAFADSFCTFLPSIALAMRVLLA